jgi:hypothetical protein
VEISAIAFRGKVKFNQLLIEPQEIIAIFSISIAIAFLNFVIPTNGDRNLLYFHRDHLF